MGLLVNFYKYKILLIIIDKIYDLWNKNRRIYWSKILLHFGITLFWSKIWNNTLEMLLLQDTFFFGINMGKIHVGEKIMVSKIRKWIE